MSQFKKAKPPKQHSDRTILCDIAARVDPLRSYADTILFDSARKAYVATDGHTLYFTKGLPDPVDRSVNLDCPKHVLIAASAFEKAFTPTHPWPVLYPEGTAEAERTFPAWENAAFCDWTPTWRATIRVPDWCRDVKRVCELSVNGVCVDARYLSPWAGQTLCIAGAGAFYPVVIYDAVGEPTRDNLLDVFTWWCLIMPLRASVGFVADIKAIGVVAPKVAV